MKAKLMAVCLVLILGALFLGGCAWWDNLVTGGNGMTGPGSSWMVIDGSIPALATERAGERNWHIQQTAQAED